MTLTNINGVEKLLRLKDLNLVLCTSLESIMAVSGLVQLSTIEIHTCKKLNDISALRDCDELREISMECNNGEINSIAFVENVPLLEKSFLIGIKVMDADFRALLKHKALKK